MRGKPLPFSEYSIITDSPATAARREACGSPINWEIEDEPQLNLILWPEGHIDWNNYKFEPVPDSETNQVQQWPDSQR